MTDTLVAPGRTGFMIVYYSPELRLQVADVAKLWNELCGLPEEVLERFGYTPDTKLSGCGFEVKRGGALEDRKLDMHITLAARDQLLSSADAVGDGGQFRAFILGACGLLAALEEHVIAHAEYVEREYELPGFAEEVRLGSPNWMLRFLRYLGDCTQGDVIALPHADKGGFTLHLFEDKPGLQYLSSDRRWLPMEVSGDRTAIIPGLQLQHRSCGKLIATSHRVVATAESAAAGRDSAVLFIDFKYPWYFDKKRWGPQQAMPLAFNYTLTHEDLDRYFTS